MVYEELVSTVATSELSLRYNLIIYILIIYLLYLFPVFHPGFPIRTRGSPQGPPGYWRCSGCWSLRPPDWRTTNGVCCKQKWGRTYWNGNHAICGRKRCTSQEAARWSGFYLNHSKSCEWWNTSSWIKRDVQKKQVENEGTKRIVALEWRKTLVFKETLYNGS